MHQDGDVYAGKTLLDLDISRAGNRPRKVDGQGAGYHVDGGSRDNLVRIEAHARKGMEERKGSAAIADQATQTAPAQYRIEGYRRDRTRRLR